MEFTRLFDALYYQKEHYPLEIALAEKIEGQWVSYSTDYCLEMINRVSRGLYNYGIRPGDKIAIVSSSRPAWNWIDIGMMQIGAINIPVYPNISVDDYRFIFNEAEVKMAFVQDRSLYVKIDHIRHDVPSLQNIFTFNEIHGMPHWTQILEGEESVDQKQVEAIKNEIRPEDLATIIYTSGTTGTPKGVMLSHDNLVSNAKSAHSVLPLKTGHRILSSLPICHVFERLACYLFMYVGASVYYAERVESIADNLKEVKPHFFTTVPRLLEKMYERIIARGNALTGFKKKLFFWSVRLADQYDPAKRQPLLYRVKLAVANRLIFNKWREAVGGSVVGIVSGAAALQPRLARIFNAAGIPVCEGYGQTEASPVISFNRFDNSGSRIGTVGIPIPGVEVKIAADGEICVKGRNVMLGYYKRPDLTKEAIDDERWLHTGDVGEFVEGKFLKITDRKKELFKTSGGKYVAPQHVENIFRESFLIDHVMVIGENRKTISALIVPAIPSLETWCEENGLKFATKEEMLRSPEVNKKYAQIRDEFNKRLSEVEKVKKFVLVHDEWTVDTGHITPTLKVKRKVVHEKYKELIAQIYNED